jgi:hypothetical protein
VPSRNLEIEKHLEDRVLSLFLNLQYRSDKDAVLDRRVVCAIAIQFDLEALDIDITTEYFSSVSHKIQ